MSPNSGKYAVKHLEEFGELPSVNSVIQNTDDFEVIDAGESVETLAKKLIERNVKNLQKQFLIDTSQKFGELSANEIIEKMELMAQEFRDKSTFIESNDCLQGSLNFCIWVS